MSGARDRYHKTPSEIEADKAVAAYRGREMQMYTIHRCIPDDASTRLLDRLAADDVEAWQSVLFTGGSNGGSRPTL